MTYLLVLRAVKGTVSAVDIKIGAYQAKFTELKNAFLNHAVLKTELTILHVLDTLEKIGVFCFQVTISS